MAAQPHRGSVLEPEEYADSVRLRLGCPWLREPIPCAACQTRSLDTGAAHATCCALGEATACHNAATALVHTTAQSCDHTAETEVPGLIPGTDLRPLSHRPGHLDLLSARTASWPRLRAIQARGPKSPLRPTLSLTLPAEHLLHTNRVDCLWATPPRHADRFSFSQQIRRAQTQLCLC